jgi:hypothetical protein
MPIQSVPGTELIRRLPPSVLQEHQFFWPLSERPPARMEPRHTEWEFRRGAGAIARTLMGIRGRTTRKNTTGERRTGSIQPGKLSASLISPFFAEASTADSRVLRPCSAYAHLVRCLHSTLPCFTKIRLHAAKKLQRIAFIVNCGVTNIRESDGCPAARAAGFGGSVRP